MILWFLKVFKYIQWLTFLLRKKKEVKSPTVGDLKRSSTAAFALKHGGG